jgi:cell division transport system permease protein
VPRPDYFWRETASGLRRNGIVAFAAMSTSFIALFLFGLSLLIGRQIDLLVQAVTSNVEVTVYLTDPVKDEIRLSLTETLQQLPAVESVEYESKEEAWQRFQDLFANQRTTIENADPDAIPASLRVKLSDTALYAQVTEALGCAPDPVTGQMSCATPGVREVNDYRQLLDRLSTITKVLSWSVGAVALLMLASAVALVANTLRMGMFARRKEIGIMRLVGATNWRIRVLGAGAAIIALFLGKVFFIDQLRGETLQWLPLIRNSDVLWVTPFIVVAALLIALVAGTIGMRRFLDV